LEARSIERDHVAVLQLARAGQRLAGDPQIARATTRLNEEHVLETTDLDAAGDAVEHDILVVCSAERHGQLRGTALVPPTAILDRHDRISPTLCRCRCHSPFPAVLMGSTQTMLI